MGVYQKQNSLASQCQQVWLIRPDFEVYNFEIIQKSNGRSPSYTINIAEFEFQKRRKHHQPVKRCD